jgi:hypothetical protein
LNKKENHSTKITALELEKLSVIASVRLSIEYRMAQTILNRRNTIGVLSTERVNAFLK